VFFFVVIGITRPIRGVITRSTIVCGHDEANRIKLGGR